MFKLVMKNIELKDLTWSTNEFSKLVVDGCIMRPEVWKLTLRLKVAGKLFYIPLFKVTN